MHCHLFPGPRQFVFIGPPDEEENLQKPKTLGLRQQDFSKVILKITEAVYKIFY